MPSVEVRDEIDAPIDVVWNLLSDFGGVTRIAPQVEACTLEGEGVGAVRTINSNGVVVQERLESLDHGAHRFSYSIVSGPIPFTSYVAHVTLRTSGARKTEVHWAGSFEPAGMPEEQLCQLVTSIYRGLIAGIKNAVTA